MADFLDVQRHVRAQLKVNIPGNHAEMNNNVLFLRCTFLNTFYECNQQRKYYIPRKCRVLFSRSRPWGNQGEAAIYSKCIQRLSPKLFFSFLCLIDIRISVVKMQIYRDKRGVNDTAAHTHQFSGTRVTRVCINTHNNRSMSDSPKVLWKDVTVNTETHMTHAHFDLFVEIRSQRKHISAVKVKCICVNMY